VTFDQAIRLEGIDGVIEEGVVTLEELIVLWGDDKEPLDFKRFSAWYTEVLKFLDEYLWDGAVAPPNELMDDIEETESREYTDAELLEDAPTSRTVEDVLGDDPEDGEAAAPAKRENVEITRLFREACDSDNRLDFEGLMEISEIAELLEDDELTEDELKGMWDSLRKQGDKIDVLAFRELLSQVDDLFEYVEEAPKKQQKVQASAGGQTNLKEPAEENVALEQKTAEPTDVAKVKKQLFATIADLAKSEEGNCGLDGDATTDVAINKLTAQLEQVWRDQVYDAEGFENYDAAPLVGDWELVYTTSPKFRRWRSVLNTGQDIKKGKFEALVENICMNEDDFANEYDMEELFITEDENKELAVRTMGSWNIGLQPNVVTGEDDLVFRLQLNDVEYDTEDGEVEKADKKTLASQMCRTYSYMFLSYVDEDMRVMRTGLTGRNTFIYRKLPDVEPEDSE